MIGKASPQMDFFDRQIFNRIPQNNILVKIKRVVDFESIAKKIEPYYDSEASGPSILADSHYD